MSRGGVIRLLDQIKTYPFPNFSLNKQSWHFLSFLKFKWSLGTSLTFTIHIKQACKSIWAAESKACNLQECKGKGLEDSNAIGDTDVFGVVPIGGAIVHPR